MKSNNKPTKLHRGLEQRHISLMSLGATIGVGLFLGSSSAIKLAGPGILIAYVVAGVMLFIIMRALGEMALKNPVSGSFSRYARDYVSPLAGYLTGWNYWFFWIVTCMAEITAVGIYMEFWFPNVPRWVWTLAALVIMVTANFITVKLYGEFEFWFALIKIVAILFMIVAGLGVIIFGIGNGGIATGIHNLWSHGGFLPNGSSGILMSLTLVAFAYGGMEMLGLTAGESKDPAQSLPKAINNVIWRILVFYVGALFVILSIYPWNEIGTSGSPFVMTFEKLGIREAAGIINFVVITSALSSCNSGIYSTGRMLFNLAEQGQAPSRFSRLTKNGIPGNAIIVSAAVLIIGVALNYLVPAKVFIWITAISTFSSIWAWGIILVSQIRFRRRLSQKEREALFFKTPFFPYSSYIALAFLGLILGVMAYFPDTRFALIIGPIWYAILTAIYYGKGYHKTSENNQEDTLESTVS
ncbi:amino acid permease [Paenibacillus durus]|uniref:D-alanine/D-serine/glycine permease n=1 Tax=Paenibacillus durus ATCC 35681 TaxID=1333534 RepID=A0A0F7F7W3_PAEDU|nr:amino acid permease [Paenibacillus durus]AKG33709.1 D-alanine/D-serine/glycine permease [Paenibacillus durus ATCC 35681]